MPRRKREPHDDLIPDEPNVTPVPESDFGDGSIEPPPKGKVIPPKSMADGSINPKYFQVKLENLNELNEWSLRTHHAPLKGYASHLRGLEQEAKLAGIDKRAAFGETVDDKVEAVLRKLIDDPKMDHLFELEDAQLDKLEESMQRAVIASQKIVQERLSEAEQKASEWRLAAIPKWLSRLARVRRLRDMARNPMPTFLKKEQYRLPPDEKIAWRASHIARWMMYVFRSDTAESRIDRVMTFPEHLAKTCVDFWEAYHGVHWTGCAWNKTELEKDTEQRYVSKNGGPIEGLVKCTGLIILMPPGHLKSTLGYAISSWILCTNTATQGMIVHAKDDEASRIFRYLRDAFRTSDAKGRRLLCLVPGLAAEKVLTDALWLKNDEPTTNPQMRPVGVGNAISGANNTFQWWDDIVDPKTINEADVRQNLRDRVSQVFLPRLRTGKVFHLVTATLWHVDDPVNMLVKMAEKGELPYAVSKQKCGGPASYPKFRPLWDKYPSSYLKAKYQQIGSHGYACQYEVNPLTDDARVIRKLQLYLSSVEDYTKYTDCKRASEPGYGCNKCHACHLNMHREFLKSAQFHLSLDPSATKEADATRTTDKSGMVWAAFGDLTRRVMNDDRMIEDRVTRIRILSAMQFHASPQEAIQRVYQFAMTNKVNTVHVEVVGFSGVIVDNIRNQTGLGPSDVIGHKVHSRSKRQRLLDVAPMIEATGWEHHGMNPPVVEFPGVLNEAGDLVPDPQLVWLYNQIVDFGQTGEDHCVDALTQLCKALAPKAESGAGVFSMASEFARKENDLHEERRKRMAEQYEAMRKKKDADAVGEEVRFIVEGNQS